MAIELAEAYLSLIPSLRGAKKSIDGQLRGIDASSGGAAIGGTVARGLAQAVGSEAPSGIARAVSGTESVAAGERGGSLIGRALTGAMNAGFSVRAVGGKIESIGAGTQRVGQALTNNVTRPAAGAAKAAVAVATGLGTITAVKGMDRLVAIDSARKKLEGLGHSAKTVDEVMANATASVKGTAFGLGDAVTAAASAVASGVKPGKDLTRTLTVIGDTATIAGASFTDTAAIFNSVLARGKLQGDDMLQLTSRGVPVLKALEKQTGKTGDELQDMISKGQISFEVFQKAMEDTCGGAALKSGEMFTGTVSNMWAAVGRLGASFLDAGGNGNGFFTQLIPLIGDATSLISDAESVAAKWGDVFGRSFKVVIDKGGELARVFRPENFSLEITTAQADDMVSRVSAGMDMLIDGARDLKREWDVLPEPVKDTARQAALIAPAVGPAVTVVGRLTGGVGNLVSMTGNAVVGAAQMAARFRQVRSINSSMSSLASRIDALAASTSGAASASGDLAQKSKEGARQSRLMGAASGIAKGALIGLAVAGVALLVTKLMEAKKREDEMRGATDSLASASRGAWRRISDSSREGASAQADSMRSIREQVDETIRKQAELAQSIKNSNTDAYGDVQTLENYRRTIEELTGKTDENGKAAKLTEEEQLRLKAAVDGVNSIMGTAYEVTDDYTGRLRDEEGAVVKDRDAILKLIEAKKQQIQVEALQGQYSDLVRQQASDQEVLAEAKMKAMEAQRKLDEYSGADVNYLLFLESNYRSAEAEVTRCEEALNATGEALANVDQRMTLAQKGVQGAQDAFSGFANSNSALIVPSLAESGQSIERFVQDLRNAGASSQELSDLSATSIVELAGAYDGSVSSIASKLQEMGVSFSEFKADAAKSAQEAARAPQDVTKAVQAQQVPLRTAASAVAEGGTELKKYNGSSYGWGEEFGGNWVKGVLSKVASAMSASSQLASASAAPLKHSVPKVGPLRNGGKGEAEWGAHMVQNFISGVDREKGALESALDEAAAISAKSLRHVPAAASAEGRRAASAAARQEAAGDPALVAEAVALLRAIAASLSGGLNVELDGSRVSRRVDENQGRYAALRSKKGV